MSSGLKFEIAGRTVNQKQFFDNIQKSAVDLATNAVRKRISGVRCPVHGKSAGDLRQVAGQDGNLQWTYSACCSELRSAVERSMS